MEKVKQFFEALHSDPRGSELLGGTVRPESEEEQLRAYVKAAEALGFSLTAEEIAEGIKAIASERAAATERAADAVKKLDSDELDSVAGGTDIPTKDPKCANTFKQQENCWLNDGCDQIYNDYGNYVCNHLDHGWEVV